MLGMAPSSWPNDGGRDTCSEDSKPEEHPGNEVRPEPGALFVGHELGLFRISGPQCAAEMEHFIRTPAPMGSFEALMFALSIAGGSENVPSC